MPIHSRTYLLIIFAVTLVACDANAAPPTKTETKTKTKTKAISAKSLANTYAWLNAQDADVDVIALHERFAPPEGYERIAVEDQSFGAFLRSLPTRADRTSVRSHTGKRLSSPSAAVVLMDVGERNLQQCADTVIRLHAEYLWSKGQPEKLGYHFTSGDETRWSNWQNGERYEISGSKVERVQRSAVANTHAQFRRWLDTVFMYAGTRSLRFDSEPVEGAVIPGDFFVAPGSPGHAVVVLDIAENADGERVALLGQGFMPAQELHVLRSRQADVHDSVWFELPDAGEALETPSWRPFSREQARRFD